MTYFTCACICECIAPQSPLRLLAYLQPSTGTAANVASSSSSVTGARRRTCARSCSLSTYLLLTTHYSLLTTHCSLLTTHYSLLTTRHAPIRRGSICLATLLHYYIIIIHYYLAYFRRRGSIYPSACPSTPRRSGRGGPGAAAHASRSARARASAVTSAPREGTTSTCVLALQREGTMNVSTAAPVRHARRASVPATTAVCRWGRRNGCC